MRIIRLFPFLLALAISMAVISMIGAPFAIAGRSLTVFAAASLSDAMFEAGDKFEEEQGFTVVFSFSASSTIARQVIAGAPAGMIALANEAWADYLTERGAIQPESRTSPIGNRLVLVAPPGSAPALSNPPTAAELAAILAPPNRIALAETSHVPAGIYARQALETLGLWPTVSPRLALTDNVRGALALVARGEAALGVVYATDAALSPGIEILATLPASAHDPIAYPFAITRDGDSPEARAFLAFLTSDAGLEIFRRFGFIRN